MFLLDANAFMEANRLYYAFDLAPGFWTWLEDPGLAEICMRARRTLQGRAGACQKQIENDTFLTWEVNGMTMAQQRLWEIALDQHGFVTTDDARALGIAAHTLRFLAQRGTLRREAHGVYRFERFPASNADDYMQAVLWTGRPDAALAHETALDLLDLADVNPDRVHVTVPIGARVRRQGGERIVVHEEDLTAADLGWWQGIRCATAATAIRQVIDADTTQVHLISQAVETARARGAITAEERDALLKRMGASLAE